MRKYLSLVAAALTCALCIAPSAAEIEGDIRLWLGKKWMDEDWRQMDNPEEYGVGASFGGVDWPVMIAVDVLMSSDDGSFTYEYDYGAVYRYDLDVDGTEIDLGFRKFWNVHDKLRPYVGGGLAWIKLEGTLDYSQPDPLDDSQVITGSIQVDDTGTGLWLNAGAHWAILPKFYVGLDLRYSDADVTYDLEALLGTSQIGFSGKLDGGGTHAGIVFGHRW